MKNKQKNNYMLKIKPRKFFGFLLAFSLLILIPSFSPVFAQASSPVYRFWHSTRKYYFFTNSEAEKAKVLAYADWNYDGIAWNAYPTTDAGLIPVYRLYNRNNLYHYFTANAAERSTLIAGGWISEGIGWYAYAKEQPNTVPVYKFRNIATRRFIYTTSLGEKNCFFKSYPAGTWEDNGIAFWVPTEGANLSTDETLCRAPLGPEISVGLWGYTKSGINDNPFKIEANKDYRIKDKNGAVIAKISAATITKIKYDSNGNLKIYNSIPEKIINKEVIFDAADGNNSNLILDVSRPNSSYDKYRGKIKVRYNDTDKLIWVINFLPLEHYTWGMGETTGTGPIEHTKVMTEIFRTYGYWYIKYATKYAPYGFKIKSDSGSQIYRGYDWEIAHPNIRKAALATGGKVVTYDNDVALTPYSSWTDGRTRSFQERWGSTAYPWCKSVKDPYGKHPTMTTAQLEAAGNHMVGMSANGSLKLAGDAYKWDWQKILKYYYTGIIIKQIY